VRTTRGGQSFDVHFSKISVLLLGVGEFGATVTLTDATCAFQASKSVVSSGKDQLLEEGLVARRVMGGPSRDWF
jgi:hypothetical protein